MSPSIPMMTNLLFDEEIFSIVVFSVLILMKTNFDGAGFGTYRPLVCVTTVSPPFRHPPWMMLVFSRFSS